MLLTASLQTAGNVLPIYYSSCTLWFQLHGSPQNNFKRKSLVIWWWDKSWGTASSEHVYCHTSWLSGNQSCKVTYLVTFSFQERVCRMYLILCAFISWPSSSSDDELLKFLVWYPAKYDISLLAWWLDAEIETWPLLIVPDICVEVIGV